ncbi:acetylxylan esterase [Opitutus sp. ER46]|uniref:alpha/beta hydrolase n=1 Tax=Opitutus sp. ER46 TaxID=2161864 RepID=UPI000D2FE5E1|nr:acetylxylan esterase [Opitutus sp. ER46]PTX94213.1 acetylxylan esterase [Opitutus sp. ER46]
MRLYAFVALLPFVLALPATVAVGASAAASVTASAARNVAWVPSDILPPAPTSGPALCPGGYLKPEQGQAILDAALARFPDRAAWDAYAAHVRQRIQEGAGLAPWPRRTPLNAVLRARRTHQGYSVENVAFESVPGYFVTGNLYRPLHPTGRTPAVLATHGHTGKITQPSDYDHHARFSPGVQARAATLARMGATVLAIDMFGCGDSIQLVGQAAHRQPTALTIHLWNAMRAVDFLQSLPEVDPARIAVSGESGGGTQAFLLTALDPRIAVSVPVVMVSSYFFGGCPCESGLPIHRSADHFASNAMIAALAAPRPMLVVSDGADWTRHVPESEFPFLRAIYARYGAENAVANVHLPREGHDYGPSKRAAAARFLAERLGLNLAAVQGPDGAIDESPVTIERATALHVFDAEYPIPAHALHTAEAYAAALRQLQQPESGSPAGAPAPR